MSNWYIVILILHKNKIFHAAVLWAFQVFLHFKYFQFILAPAFILKLYLPAYFSIFFKAVCFLCFLSLSNFSLFSQAFSFFKILLFLQISSFFTSLLFFQNPSQSSNFSYSFQCSSFSQNASLFSKLFLYIKLFILAKFFLISKLLFVFKILLLFSKFFRFCNSSFFPTSFNNLNPFRSCKR